MAHAWGTLLEYVRTGQPAYEKVFGRPFWEDLDAHPKIAADFDALMGPTGHGAPDFDIELTGGWERIRTIVDVGGGTGAMLASLLRRHSHVRGTLVDLPGTVARASAIIESAGVADRVTVEGQSFFDPLPAGADLYLEELAERLARRTDGAHPPPVCGGRPLSGESHRSRWSLARRCAAIPGHRHAGRGREDQYDHAVRRAGAKRRARGRRCRNAGIRPLRGRVRAGEAAAGEGNRPGMTQEDSEAIRARSLIHGQVCYLQIPAADSTRSAAFYEAVFGWHVERPHLDFESPGLIGQWVEGRPPARDAGPMIWIHVADLGKTLERVTAHGGEVLEPPSADGPTRILATIIDPEGNPIGLAGHAPPR